MQPHEFPRRVLFCVAGMTPQIVTETLYALAVETDGRPAFVPTEIHVLSTSSGAEQVRLSLLAKDRDQFGRLCRDYGLTGIRFDASMIEVMHDGDGQPLTDIRTPEDNEVAADAITRKIADLTCDKEAAVHVSIAGGRKSMGFFAGYALSLYGRIQDRLSHVLVNERFEQLRDFYFKPKTPVTLLDSKGREVSTADARIHLAEIPFVPLSEGMQKLLVDRKAGYAETVRAWLRSSRQQDVLIIDCAQHAISWGGYRARLSPTHFAIYVWFAHRRKAGLKDGWVSRQDLVRDTETQRDFPRVARRYLKPFAISEKLEQLLDRFDKAGPMLDGAQELDHHLSRLSKKLEEAFDVLAARTIGIEKERIVASDEKDRNRKPRGSGHGGRDAAKASGRNVRYRLRLPVELICIEAPNRASA